MKKKQLLKATTVMGIIHKGETVLGADGQATLGDCVLKEQVQKVRKINKGKILAGFAGSTADALSLLDRFEEKLHNHQENLKRSAVELVKDWRTDRYLRRLEAMLVVADTQDLLLISGNGDVMSLENNIVCIGSGGQYARAAGIALKKHVPDLSAEEIVKTSLQVAADICIYTNHHFVIEKLESPE
ncbi:MAG: ATP-dependent protease subunit HslV [Cytophagales bacterium]|nr:ATP-dependent protease subunit HslV [Cytophagales bacterium]